MTIHQLLVAGNPSGVVNHTVNLTSDNNIFCDYFDPPLTSCSVTETYTANVSNGVGPFTYDWSIIYDPDVVFSIPGSTTSSTCGLVSSASAGIYNYTIRCDVTDTGNGNYMVRTDVSGSYHEHALA